MNGIRRIVILGGGSAGWMAAAALTTGLRGVRVELIESEEIGIIGVGEATFPSIRQFNDILGIAETDFLAATRGSYKLGIQFCDWKQRGQHFFHTFGDFGQLDGPMALWGQLRRLQAAPGTPLGEFCLPSVMAAHGRFCRPAEGEDSLASRYTYAYHFDATLYAAFLRRLAEGRGARRTEGRVVGVDRHEDGRLRALRLADGREVEGDLFIDCSGLASLLIGQTLEQRFIDYSHWLPVDRAWAVPTERASAELTPFTRATALEAGWIWRIPLQDRTGNGHVFSSRFIDEGRAREQLLAQLDAPMLAEPRLLRFRTGHRERFWVQNVVAIGLSAGFLEPLESTSIFLVHNALGRLIPLLGETDLTQAAVGFNVQQLRQYQRIRDFILLHYVLSERRDSEFWRVLTSMSSARPSEGAQLPRGEIERSAKGASVRLPESLDYKLHAWRETGTLHTYDNEAFDASSWLAIHAGMGHWPRRCSPWPDEMPAELAARYLSERHQAIAALASRMPDHDSYLRSRLGRAAG